MTEKTTGGEILQATSIPGTGRVTPPHTVVEALESALQREAALWAIVDEWVAARAAWDFATNGGAYLSPSAQPILDRMLRANTAVVRHAQTAERS